MNTPIPSFGCRVARFRNLPAFLFSLLIAAAWMQGTLVGQIPGDRLKNLCPPDFQIGGVLGGYDTDLSRVSILPTIRNEFNAITAKAFMPFGPWTDGSQPIDTSGLTRLVDWATQNQKRVHAHILVYPTENIRLPWFQALNDSQVEATLERYVRTMAGSTSGRVWVWDVVNEVIGDPGDVVDEFGIRIGLGNGDSFRPYKEYQAMGPAYIAKAFQWAKEADPNALLIINEYSAETLGEKSDRLLELCLRLRAEGVPIDGVGFQNHWLDIRYEPNYESIRENFRRFADAGFKIFITECDIAAKHTTDAVGNPPSAEELSRQDRIFSNLLQIALEEPACKSFLMWDFTDETSWLQNTDFSLTLADRRPGFEDTVIPFGTSMFATPFSGGGLTPIQPKPAYFGMQSVLRAHPGDTYRITSGWEPNTSFLARFGFQTADGSYQPGEPAYLESLTPQSLTWSSLKWRLEKARPGIYRIRSLWSDGKDYLTRLGGGPNFAVPGSVLSMLPLNLNWSSQQWGLIPVGNDGGFHVYSGWSPLDGVLTREAAGPNSAGEFQPGPETRLYPLENWTSQIWFFDRIGQ
ncbi:MAG: endo-1,4-beta-xylanase [Planctomycetota bacterium]